MEAYKMGGYSLLALNTQDGSITIWSSKTPFDDDKKEVIEYYFGGLEDITLYHFDDGIKISLMDYESTAEHFLFD